MKTRLTVRDFRLPAKGSETNDCGFAEIYLDDWSSVFVLISVTRYPGFNIWSAYVSDDFDCAKSGEITAYTKKELAARVNGFIDGIKKGLLP